MEVFWNSVIFFAMLVVNQLVKEENKSAET